MQTINQWLAGRGVNASQVRFTSARSVSADGLTVVGQLGGESGNAFLARASSVLIEKGDINGDTVVDLANAILALQLLANKPLTGVQLGADVNGDGRIGLPEVSYILQSLSGLR